MQTSTNTKDEKKYLFFIIYEFKTFLPESHYCISTENRL